MNLADYLFELESNGSMLAAAAGEAGPDAVVTTCPDWFIRDLVLHTGEVHRWAASIVRRQVTNPAAEADTDYLGALPRDQELVAWFVAGLTALVDALHEADPSAPYFTFLEDPPSPFTFWPRRQALETAIHRIDAESALGRNSGISVALAADGIDEMLTGFAPRKRTPLRSEIPRVLQIAPTDTNAVWRLTISEQPVVSVRTAGDADCSVSGQSSDIYQALWNRTGTDKLTVSGDTSVFEMFRNNVKIRWS